ncbi:MAG: hypothetical protein U0872_10440 [Planctomycetaceae bacterium]
MLLELHVEPEAYAKQHSADELGAVDQAWSGLSELQAAPGRVTSTSLAELSATQVSLVQLAAKSLPDTLAEPAGLSDAMTRDLQQHRRKTGWPAEKKFVGRELPEFAVKGLERGRDQLESWRGQVVVLHFWEYPGDNPSELYGKSAISDFPNDNAKNSA